MKNKWYKPKRHWKEIELWKDVPEEKWNDWLWQLTHTVRTLDDLKKVINLTEDEEEGVESSDELEIDAENTTKEAYSDNADSSDDEKK